VKYSVEKYEESENESIEEIMAKAKINEEKKKRNNGTSMAMKILESQLKMA
jgi:hypothetical protein